MGLAGHRIAKTFILLLVAYSRCTTGESLETISKNSTSVVNNEQSSIFESQPHNTTIEQGTSFVIPCKLKDNSGATRRWIINGTDVSETNLSPGFFAVPDGLYVDGKVSASNNWYSMIFQCYRTTYFGPPSYFKFDYSSIGVLAFVKPKPRDTPSSSIIILPSTTDNMPSMMTEEVVASVITSPIIPEDDIILAIKKEVLIALLFISLMIVLVLLVGTGLLIMVYYHQKRRYEIEKRIKSTYVINIAI